MFPDHRTRAITPNRSRKVKKSICYFSLFTESLFVFACGGGCSHGCGEWFQRCSVVLHETEQCGERPFSCQHCEDYHSTFEDVTKVHHLECDQYPLLCPNRCRENTFERWELKNHLDQCPLALIDCSTTQGAMHEYFSKFWLSTHRRRQLFTWPYLHVSQRI